jgi:BirA family transcriptional regulator, biotin operon repressor / biotin---[acetyl-CoA-carboxylase] ligase
VIDGNAPRVVFDAIDSTNAEAARRAAAGDVGPLWIRATEQSAGRGRRGRSWTSDPGNLFITYLGAMARPPAEIALLSFAAALAVADVADHVIGRPTALLKWPNDVMIVGRKVAGILLESGAASDGRTWVAVGIGINVASAPSDVNQPIVALSAVTGAKAITLDALEALLRRRLAFWAGCLERDGFVQLREAWLARAHGLGGLVVARLGQEEVTGVLRGISADGAMELDVPDKGTRLISAGEVFFGAATAA